MLCYAVLLPLSLHQQPTTDLLNEASLVVRQPAAVVAVVLLLRQRVVQVCVQRVLR